MPNPLAPPGQTTDYRAERALVLAPHFDDEVLGCGGLLAHLVDGGCRVQVVFLTDSAGGDEGADDPAAYGARRRQESVAGLAVLGITDVAFLDLPDGALDRHLEACADGIRTAILEHRPQILLSVGPTEITRDHQAAFAALHRTLAPLRGLNEVTEALAETRILLYEVNHPAHPDSLVDVTDVLPRLEKAIRCHASQLARHDYLAAALGARRWRTLSLPASVIAAEGYREVTPADLTTRSLAGSVRWLGALPDLHVIEEGPLVSVIVRTRNRPGLLGEALSSLADQTWRRLEVILVNDGGDPPLLPGDLDLELRHVDLDPGRGRAGAANAGIAAAKGHWIAFLDDDDLAEPEHLETLVGIASAAGVRVAYTDAAVGIYELDADAGWRLVERRLPYSRDFDPELLLLDNYIPFNTLLIEAELLRAVGPLDESLPFFEDWELLIRLAAHAPFHHLPRVTAEYRHFRSGGHHVFGERPAMRADFLTHKARVIGRHADRCGPEVLARVIDRLRAETVEWFEAATSRGHELATTRLELAERTDAWHRLNGERAGLVETIAALEADRDAHREHAAELGREIESLRRQEVELRRVVEDQDAHLGRTYGEIERLNEVIRAMESSRAWRWHLRIQRLLGRG